MTRISWYGYDLEVDAQATRDWYAQAEEWDCDCGHCRNFLALARRRALPAEALSLLDALGIPPEKAAGVCERCAAGDKGLVYDVSWRVAGRIAGKPAGEDAGPAWGPLVEFFWGNLVFGRETGSLTAPNFPQPCFDLGCTAVLPWVLDEPMDGPEEG